MADANIKTFVFRSAFVFKKYPDESLKIATK